MATIRISSDRKGSDMQIGVAVVYALFREPIDITTNGDVMDGFYKAYLVKHSGIPDTVNEISLLFQPDHLPNPGIVGINRFANVDGQNIYYFEDPGHRYEKETFARMKQEAT